MNSGLRRWLLTGYVALACGFILLPIVIVVLTSLTNADYISFPPHGLSLKWYAEVLSDPSWMRSLRTSLAIAALVTGIALLGGVTAALGLRLARGAWAAGLQILFLSPLMLPTIIIGLAVLRFYQSVGMPASVLTVALGQAVIATPYVIRLVLASLTGADPNLERAARNLGASRWRTFWRVTFPLARHGIVAGGLFAFIVSLDDVNIALFLSDIHTTPLPVALFSYIEQNADPLGAAVASLLVFLALILMVVCDRAVGIERLFGLKS
jgi:putative spermidine/putrescine transport system permease protein